MQLHLRIGNFLTLAEYPAQDMQLSFAESYI